MELSLEKIFIITKIEEEMSKGILRKKCFTKNQLVTLLNGSSHSQRIIDECIVERILIMNYDNSFILDNKKVNEVFDESVLWNKILEAVNIHENPAFKFDVYHHDK